MRYIIPNFYDLQITTHMTTLTYMKSTKLNCTGYEPSHVYNGVCILRSQNLTVVSPDPLANFWLSGLNWTDITASAWPGNELKTVWRLNIYIHGRLINKQNLHYRHYSRSPCASRDWSYLEHGLFLINYIYNAFGHQLFVFQTRIQSVSDFFIVDEKCIRHSFVLKWSKKKKKRPRFKNNTERNTKVGYSQWVHRCVILPVGESSCISVAIDWRWHSAVSPSY